MILSKYACPLQKENTLNIQGFKKNLRSKQSYKTSSADQNIKLAPKSHMTLIVTHKKADPRQVVRNLHFQ